MGNFIVYIQQYLRDEFVEVMNVKRDLHLGMQGLNVTTTALEIPERFVLSEVMQDRRLALFASRLAQKTERERREKNRALKCVRSHRKGKVYVRQDGRDPCPLQTKGLGSHGGSSLLLPAVSRRASERALLAEKEDQPLEGKKLERAVAKIFIQALTKLRQSGTVVLHDPSVSCDRLLKQQDRRAEAAQDILSIDRPPWEIDPALIFGEGGLKA